MRTKEQIEFMLRTASQYEASAKEADPAIAIDLEIQAKRLRAQAAYWERRLPGSWM